MVCLEIMLLRVVWDACGDVWKNDFSMILAMGESSEIGLNVRFLDQGLCLVWVLG